MSAQQVLCNGPGCGKALMFMNDINKKYFCFCSPKCANNWRSKKK